MTRTVIESKLKAFNIQHNQEQEDQQQPPSRPSQQPRNSAIPSHQNPIDAAIHQGHVVFIDMFGTHHLITDDVIKVCGGVISLQIFA